jgi:erythromycin esterase-like protein
MVCFSNRSEFRVQTGHAPMSRNEGAGMTVSSAQDVTDRIDRVCTPLHGTDHDYDDLLDLVGERRIVLLGEASHGTHEFYRERALITRRLISELGFGAVAIEGDWPDTYRANRYVCGSSTDPDAREALDDFRRFPSWMWRNTEVCEFLDWLQAHNQTIEQQRRVGFYGLDLYSLHASIEAVIAYLETIDPPAAARARQRYSCFDRSDREGITYGSDAQWLIDAPCENAVVAQLIELRHSAATYLARNGWVGNDEYFFAQQNARVVAKAEEYYREMFRAPRSSWNLRDMHMAETLEALVQHHLGSDRDPRVVVWEHNSHVGDARSTGMSRRGEFNVGQLVRQRYGADNVLLVGFTTYDGTVTAAADWGAKTERKQLRRALPGSVEDLFHEVGHARFLLRTRLDEALAELLRVPRLHRAVGVIYRPETELQSHYVDTRVSDQFDAVIHIDHTRALEPLDRTSTWEEGEPPETYPTGI